LDIKLKITRRNEDGSADATVDYDDEWLQVIVQYVVIAMLKEALKEEKDMRKKSIKDKNVKWDLQMKLEDAIEDFYSVVKDTELLYKTHGDRKLPMDENEMANALLGLITKQKMLHYWAVNAYEQRFEMNDYASDEVKARRAVIMGWGEDDDDGRC
jgi:polynucleotide 5'-kinase involved in rRNA processing